jgi:CBS domain-containing protein
MNVGEFCNRTVIVAEAQDTVADVAMLMRDHHVGSVVIVAGRTEPRTPVGIITDRDVTVCVVAEGLDASQTRAAEIISSALYAAREEQDIETVLQQMRARGVRRVPVVDDHDVLQGIFTFDDLVEWSAEHMLELSRLVQREIDREHNRESA